MPWSALTSQLIALVRLSVAPVFGDIARRRRVRRKFLVNSPSADSPLIQKALSDFKIIYGHAGEVTKEIDALLTEIVDTGFLSILARDAFFEIDDPGVRFHFEALFLRAFRQTELGAEIGATCQNTYQAIRLIIRESLREQMVPSLLFLIDSSVDPADPNEHYAYNPAASIEVRRALSELRPEVAKGISNYIIPYAASPTGNIRSGLDAVLRPSWLYLSRQTIDYGIRVISVQLATRYSFLRIEGPSGRSQLCEIEKIGIMPRLREARFFVGEQRLDLLPNDEQSELIFSRLLPHDTDPKQTLIDLPPVSVILGNPGGGKSTLGQLVCHYYAKKADTANPPRLAFRVEVRKFQASGTGTFIDFLVGELASQISKFSYHTPLSDIILNCLILGTTTIVFDGVDEILSSGARRAVILEISQFCETYGHNQFVITCRTADFRVTPILGFPVFILEPFSDSEISLYYRRVSSNVFNRSDAEVSETQGRFLTEARKNAVEFMANPLLLTMVVWIFNMIRRVPDNRIQIYFECSELLFIRWDSVRAIDPDIPDKHWLPQLIMHIAKCMYLHDHADSLADIGRLKEWTEAFFRKVYLIDSYNRARLAADRFAEHLIGRSWILQERSAGVFEFTHRTFMEYFFARHMDDEYPEIDSLFAYLRPRIVSGEWIVPIHLAMQLKSTGRLGNTRRLVSLLVVLASGVENNGGERFNIRQFIGQSANYLQPPEADILKLIESLTGLIGSVREWHNFVEELLQMPASFCMLASEGVSRVIREIGRDEIKFKRSGFIADWFSAIRYRILTRHIISPDCEFYHDIQNVIAKYGDEMPTVGRDLMSAGRSKLLFDATDDVRYIQSSRDGLGLWSSSIGIAHRLDWRRLDFWRGASQAIDVLLGRCKPTEARFVQLFFSLTPAIMNQKNWVVPESTMVDFHFNDSIPSNVIDISKEQSREALTALGITLMGCLELGSIIDVRESGVVILERLKESKRIDYSVSQYICGWLNHEFCMFQPNGSHQFQPEQQMSVHLLHVF